ncbi:androgen-induced gene 1 protein-like [Glossina fuscipes fuscipes]
MSQQLIFHAFALVQTAFTLFYDLCIVKYPVTPYNWHHPLGGNMKFLTTQNMLIQTLYYIIALLNDVIGTNAMEKNLPQIRLIRDHYFASLAFPLAVYVTYQYWSLYYMGGGWVSPPVFNSVVPKWLNLAEHANVSILIFLDIFFCARRYPNRLTSLLILYSYVWAYVAWLYYVKEKAGFWVYHILTDMTKKQRRNTFAVILVKILFIYIQGELINNTVWGRQIFCLQITNDSQCDKCTQA